MNQDNVPSLSLIVDQIDLRIEYAEFQGLDDEHRALTDAREAILTHVFREHRNLSIIQIILDRLHIRPAA